MSQRISDRRLQWEIENNVGQPPHTQAELALLDLQDARAESASQEKRLQEIGEAAGPWEWATWNDLVPLVQIKMARLKEAEAEIKRLQALSASQEDAHDLRDKGLLK